ATPFGVGSEEVGPAGCADRGFVTLGHGMLLRCRKRCQHSDVRAARNSSHTGARGLVSTVRRLAVAAQRCLLTAQPIGSNTMVEPAVPTYLDAVIAETLEFLTVRPSGDGAWAGDAPDWFGDVLFGGFVIAQAIVAVTRNAPRGRRLNSLHAYFLR